MTSTPLESGEPEIFTEHRDTAAPIRLDADERDALQQLVPDLILHSVPGETELYYANPQGTVGAVRLGERRFELRPKIPIRRLAFILAYSMSPEHWQRSGFDFMEDTDLFEAVIPGFAYQVEEALRRGLLNGYQGQEEALQTVRGRIRFDEQLRSRFGISPPIECRFDEFTEDIEINRLLKAAIERAGRLHLRSASTRTRLRALRGAFQNVSAVAYDPRRIPVVNYNRLNSSFRQATEFARLILRSRSLEFRSGRVSGDAFLLKMHEVFEAFVIRALREELGLSESAFPQGASGRYLYLDEGRALRLRPDLSWWHAGRCVFVGDVKYKRTPDSVGVKNADIYQLLAYVTATQLPAGMLIYAKGEEAERVYRIPGAETRLDVLAIELDASPNAVLDQVGELADRVRDQRNQQFSRSPLPAAS